MKVNILTPYRIGGPYNWGKQLSNILNKHDIDARHIHLLPELLFSPIYQNANIIHTAVPVFWKTWRKPVVLTIHGEYPRENNEWKTLYPKAINEASVVTTPSLFLKQRLSLERAIVIPNAVFTDYYRQVKHLEKEKINLVTITKFAFLDKALGVLDICEVLNSVSKATTKTIKLTVIGGGKYLEQIKSKTKKFHINIEFTGMLQNPRGILENSDIFVYYSIHDNFPIVILEAMASGLPVLTNDVGAVGEMIQNGANGFVADSHESYCKLLLNLIENYNLRVSTGNAARKTTEISFDWNVIIKKYVEIYDNLVISK